MNISHRSKPGRALWRAKVAGSAVSLVLAILCASEVSAQSSVTTCDAAGIGSVTLVADGPAVTITSVSTGVAGSGATAVPYCLVKVLVPQAINIWVHGQGTDWHIINLVRIPLGEKEAER